MKRFGKFFLFFLLGMLVFCKILLWFLKIKFSFSLINEDICTYINYGLIAVITALMGIYFSRKLSAKITFIILGLLLMLFCFLVNAFSYFMLSHPNYYYFSSPRGNNILLLEENCSITGCTVRGYKVVYSIFKVVNLMDMVSFGEPDLPIKRSNYNIEWIDNNMVTVSVNSDGYTEEFTLDFR
ncbi:hypothetical protein [Acetivibrio cellulolyticus]|uniref:hypothetical protein n=1 Tax=Acetivibrio cellulolyticus TaxID=35830 RepID=UPI0001E2BDF3|nr:hypothetical protein [Acetivibrio cellulolyticus]